MKWHYEVQVNSLYIVRDERGREVCAVMPEDAPVIAAAPELLDALKATLFLQERGEAMAAALLAMGGDGGVAAVAKHTLALTREAIAKATGGAE